METRTIAIPTRPNCDGCRRRASAIAVTQVVAIVPTRRSAIQRAPETTRPESPSSATDGVADSPVTDLPRCSSVSRPPG